MAWLKTIVYNSLGDVSFPLIGQVRNGKSIRFKLIGPLYNVEEYVDDSTKWADLGSNSELVTALNDSLHPDGIALSVDRSNNYAYVAGLAPNHQHNMFLARYNGTSWSRVGTTTANDVSCLPEIIIESGNVYLKAYRRSNSTIEIHKWDGSSFTLVATATSVNMGGLSLKASRFSVKSGVFYLTLAPSGSLTTWYLNGSTWTQMGSVIDTGINEESGTMLTDMYGISANMHVVSQSEIYLAYSKTGVGYYIRKWDGASWSAANLLSLLHTTSAGIMRSVMSSTIIYCYGVSSINSAARNVSAYNSASSSEALLSAESVFPGTTIPNVGGAFIESICTDDTNVYAMADYMSGGAVYDGPSYYTPVYSNSIINTFSAPPVRNGVPVTSTINSSVLIAKIQSDSPDSYFDSTSKLGEAYLYFQSPDGRQQKKIVHNTTGAGLVGSTSWSTLADDGTWTLNKVKVFDANGATHTIGRASIGSDSDVALS